MFVLEGATEVPGLYGLLGFGDPLQVSCILDEMIVLAAEGPRVPGVRIGYFGDLALAVVGRPTHARRFVAHTPTTVRRSLSAGSSTGKDSSCPAARRTARHCWPAFTRGVSWPSRGSMGST